MDSLRKEFDDLLSGIAWSLWKELGIAGTDRFHENCLIQPEELIILTMILFEHDPRLRDEVLDWSSRYHELISVSRLRTLLKEVSPETLRAFSQFVAALNSISSAKWPNAAEAVHFKVKASEKSVLPTLDSPSLLMLRLRSLFGPGVKADALTHFLTRIEMQFSAADLVEIGYSKRSLMTALDHLAASGIISVTNVRNKKNYELRRSKELQVVIGRLPKIAPPWNRIVQVISRIRLVIPEIQKSSDLTKGVIFRNCLIEIESLLPAFISPILSTKPDFARDWKAVMELFRAFRQGNFFMRFEVYNEFDKIVVQLLRELYQLDDCIDGIEAIQQAKADNHNKHAEMFKECYQLFLSFVVDLESSLKQFLDFPFHEMLDEALADIAYQFSKKNLQQLSDKIKSIKSINPISTAQVAIHQYQLFMPEFDVLRQFISSFRQRLEDLYFIKTNIHLLSHLDKFNKRHLVNNLFSLDDST